MTTLADKITGAPRGEDPVTYVRQSVDYLRALLIAIGGAMVPAPENPPGASR